MDSMPIEPIFQILLAILLVAVIWTVVRSVFKLALRVFGCGCLVIFLVGGVLVLSTLGVF
jgi:uncharacterized membrane protein YhfC